MSIEVTPPQQPSKKTELSTQDLTWAQKEMGNIIMDENLKPAAERLARYDEVERDSEELAALVISTNVRLIPIKNHLI